MLVTSIETHRLRGSVQSLCSSPPGSHQSREVLRHVTGISALPPPVAHEAEFSTFGLSPYFLYMILSYFVLNREVVFLNGAGFSYSAFSCAALTLVLSLVPLADQRRPAPRPASRGRAVHTHSNTRVVSLFTFSTFIMRWCVFSVF